MKALDALQSADFSLSEFLAASENSPALANKDIDAQVRALTSAIKNELKVDYSKTVAFKPGEKERVQSIYINYLTNKKDDFNSHYIQLLAWHLHELKIMQKNGNPLSIFEYSPNPLAPFTVIEKTFRLFHKKRIDVEKISYALILNYLNNYKVASNRYKKELRAYLKSIKFSEDSDVYFDINNVLTYVAKRTAKVAPPTEPYPKRLRRLKIRLRTLDTVYFSDAWLEWMLKEANLSDEEYVLKNLDCSYFKICNEDKQKIIMAKIIHDNSTYNLMRANAESICLKYIFPAIKKGSPFTKEFWDLNYTGIYKIYLDNAWAFIEQTFVQNPNYKNMVHFGGTL